MSLPTSPESRAETYLAAIAGQNVTLPASPESRMEQYLEDIAEKMPVANPTLSGTEDNLTGLEVRGVKYKVPEGGSTHLYQHNIGVRYVTELSGQINGISGNCTVITNSDSPFTWESFVQYLRTNYDVFGFENGLAISGTIYEYRNGAQNIGSLRNIKYYSNEVQSIGASVSSNGWINWTFNALSSGPTIEDNCIVQLL